MDSHSRWDQFFELLQWWTVDRTALLIATVSAAIALWGLHQNRRIARNAARPMMMVEYMPPTLDNLHLKVKITNKGQSVARNVRFSFDPKLPDPNPDALRKTYGFKGKNTPLASVKALRVDNTFTTWPPGFESEYLFWIKPLKLDFLSTDVESMEGIPAQQKVTITFTDDLNKEYSEDFVLDIRSVAGTTFPSSERSDSAQ